jgi:hypothetical protein
MIETCYKRRIDPKVNFIEISSDKCTELFVDKIPKRETKNRRTITNNRECKYKSAN